MKKKEARRNEIRKRQMAKKRKGEQAASVKKRVLRLRRKIKKIRSRLGHLSFGRQGASRPKSASRGIFGLFRDPTLCPDRIGAYAADVAEAIRTAKKPLGRP